MPEVLEWFAVTGRVSDTGKMPEVLEWFAVTGRVSDTGKMPVVLDCRGEERPRRGDLSDLRYPTPDP
jgi:hypothetical protein